MSSVINPREMLTSIIFLSIDGSLIFSTTDISWPLVEFVFTQKQRTNLIFRGRSKFLTMKAYLKRCSGGMSVLVVRSF